MTGPVNVVLAMLYLLVVARVSFRCQVDSKEGRQAPLHNFYAAPSVPKIPRQSVKPNE